MKINPQKLLEAIEKAKKGDQISFKFLLDSYWSYVYLYQLKNIYNENDAEDITIQTFSKAFDKIDSFDEKYQFNTWLIAISKNVHIDLLRKRKNKIQTQSNSDAIEEAIKIVDDAASPEDKIIKEQNLEQLLKDIKQLKPKYQEVIQLRFFQELSYKEISDNLGQPINNIKVKLLRAKKLLAEIIEKK